MVEKHVKLAKRDSVLPLEIFPVQRVVVQPEAQAARQKTNNAQRCRVASMARTIRVRKSAFLRAFV
jgi:hypothetical protein